MPSLNHRVTVMRYGLRRPVENAELVAAQMRAAHQYRNRLTEIERARREQLRALDSEAARTSKAQVTACRCELDRLLGEMRKVRKGSRKRSESAEQRAQIKAARIALKAATQVWRDAIKLARADEYAVVARDNANEAALVSRKLARATCGAYWGTYQLIEDADQAARKAPLWDGDEPNDPRFLRWFGDGAVSVQIVGGLQLGVMMGGGSTQVAVTEQTGPDRRNPESRRSQRCKRVMLWLRIVSDDKLKPVWAQWPMLMHRPIPVGSVIKRVTVALRHIGPREEWYATFTIETPVVTSCGRGAVAVDVGWRQREDSLRVGVTCDESGELSEVALPPIIISGIRRAETLRSTRDTNFTPALAELARWLRNRADRTCPDWLVEATGTLAQWRSQARLAALAIRWRTTRFDGDAEAFDPLETWRKQDKHLWLWETSQRTGALRRRRDYYRNVAAALAKRYQTLILEDFDLRKVARLAKAETKKAENKTSRSNRQLVAVSEFRQCLRNAFLARGGKLVEVDAKNTTRACSVCGVVEEFDAATMLRHACVNGHEWDQDENAARNLIERWRVGHVAKPKNGDEPTKESRWGRAKRMRVEKVDRMAKVEAK